VTSGRRDSPPAGRCDQSCLLACFLRVADAAQIDGTRAPRWARVHRHLGTVASAHWDFQERLAQPSLVRDHLRFASLRPFEAEQALAWWTCFDALTVIDHELHEVDRVLTDSGLPRLAARGVLDVDTPARLAEHVRPDGWDPVEVRVRVTDVARLVQNLGGEALYGDHSKAPIRELIANARDAVRARIALTGDTSGLIRVSAWTTAEHDVAYLEVEDNGVGMDSRTITDTLLDFGQGLWDSPGLIEVHSGLAETDFEPIGKFGIGFFSVFMWAEKVLVLSRPFRQGEDATRLLVLDGGPGARPVLRKPHPADNRKDGGTVVRLEMREKPLGRSRQATERALERAQQRGDRLPEPTGRSSSIGGLVGQVAPALDVDLEVLHAGECELACSANDWLTIDGNELLRRIARSEENYEPISTALMPVVESDGVVVGRSALVPRPYRSNPCGVASIGGLAADTLPQPIAGIWLAIPSTAARDNSKPLATADAVRDWATRQAEYWSARLDAEDQLELAMRVIWLGGDPGPLATFRTADGPIRYQDFGTWACNRATITVVHFLARTDFPESSAIPKDTVLEPHQGFLENPFKWFDRHGALMMVYWMGDRIAEAWGVELGDLRGEKAELELTYGDSYPKHGAVKFFRPQT